MTTSGCEGGRQLSAGRISDINDIFRRSFLGGRVVLTAGVAALPRETVKSVIEGVKAFDRFDSDNDPHGEHDCGTLAVGDESVFWKIDYYDCALRLHSPDPTEPSVTTRVLTIGLAAEY